MFHLIAIALIPTFGHGKTIYQFQRGHARYSLDQSEKTLDLANEGVTYTLPVDACTKPDVDYLLSSLADHFQRLLKSEPSTSRRSGTVTSGADTRDLIELSLQESAPQAFIGLPGRFVNLMVTEHRKCPRSFEN